MDFHGNMKTNGYAASIGDKSKELSVEVNHPELASEIENLYNDVKSQHGDNPNAHFGAWIENGKIIVDASHVSNNLNQSLYAGIANQQDAIGDLAKYAKGEDGTIRITPSVFSSLEPLSSGSLKAYNSPFRTWREVKDYYKNK